VDFELTDDQRHLLEVVADVARRECPPSLLRRVIAGEDDGLALWKTVVGLDWTSLAVPVDDGGVGLGMVELAITLEELGRVVDPTPLLATTSQFVPLVRECGDPDQRRALLGAACAGASGAAAFAGTDVRAAPEPDGVVLTGTARFVLDGDRADEIAVVANSDDGLVVCVVAGAHAEATRLTTFDPTLHVADVTLDEVRVDADRVLRAGPSGHAERAERVERARQEAVTGLAAAMVGASRGMLELTLLHVSERQQFGVPIGSFQAVKHLAVDVYVAIERARVLYQFAALAIDEDDPRRSLAASMAKAAAGDAQHLAGRHCVQLFGGLGYTWENDLHLYLRRAKALEVLLGTAADHYAVVARTALPGEAPAA
jgi:alkylation response protein AidB-like acyl-CoA dehydrogenase